MQIVGLSGFARAGKDETAKVLVERYGFKQVAFADKLREMIYNINPIVNVDVYNGNRTEYLQEVIDRVGWDHYKETQYGDEIRRLLQRLGTEGGRQTLWDTIWIDAAFAGLPEDSKIVVSDARFFNEFDAIRARGGEVWRIERPGVGPANDHASEMEAIKYEFDRTIHNSRDLDYLATMIHSVYADMQTTQARNAYLRQQAGKDRQQINTENVITSAGMPKRR
jgi:hypothetical protein